MTKTTAVVFAMLTLTSRSWAEKPARVAASSPQPTRVAVSNPPQAAAPAPAPAAAAAPEAPPAKKDSGREETPVEEGESPDGFAVGARFGYALPMGSIAKDSSLGAATDLSKSASGMLPLWADIGYRLNPHWYVGGYFQLGIVSTSGDFCKRAAGESACSSSGTDLRFGGFVRYSFKPQAKISPWIGASTGYELLNLSVSAGQATADYTAKGWEFIGLHLGADYHAADNFRIGPIVMASFGQYASKSWSEPQNSGSADFNNTALHEWVLLGIRGQYDL